MKTFLGSALRCIMLVAFLGGGSAWAAETWKVIVPFAGGGAMDVLARMVAEGIQRQTGNAVVVENIPGANGNIGMAAAARAPADGKTMVVNSEAFATVNPLLFKDSMRYDPKDFTPISLLGEQQAVLATSPASGIKDFRDFLQKARSDRGITYTSAGVGSTSHLATSYLAQTVGGLKVVHVPFTGGAPAMNALVGGQVDSAFIIAGNVVPFAQSGKVVPIAVSGKTRLSQLPNVPTVAELGYPSFDAVQGMVLLVHADTPAEKKTELAKLSRAAMDSQKIREFMDRTAMKLVNSTPQEAQTWLDRERRLWTELIQNQKIIAEKP